MFSLPPKTPQNNNYTQNVDSSPQQQSTSKLKRVSKSFGKFTSQSLPAALKSGVSKIEDLVKPVLQKMGLIDKPKSEPPSVVVFNDKGDKIDAEFVLRTLDKDGNFINEKKSEDQNNHESIASSSHAQVELESPPSAPTEQSKETISDIAPPQPKTEPQKPTPIPVRGSSRTSNEPVFNKAGKEVASRPINTPFGSVNFTGTDDVRFNVRVLFKQLVDDEVVEPKVENNIATLFLNIDGKHCKVQVYVDELADKLLMNKEKVIGLIESGKLPQYLESKQAKLKKLPQIIDDYSNLFAQAGNRADPAQLIKIVKVFNKADVSEVLVQLKPKYQNAIAMVGREGGEIRVLGDREVIPFAAGTYGTVYKVQDFVTKEMLAFKEPNLDTEPQQAIDDIQNEVFMLRLLNEGGKSLGIMAGVFTTIANGFAMRLMDASASKMVQKDEYKKAPNGVKIDCCYQIIAGNVEIERRGIRHIDQKPDNVLMKKSAENPGLYQVDISDFGGANIVGDGKSPVLTPQYVPGIDVYNHQEDMSYPTAVYQAGVVLYSLLTDGGKPNPLLTEVNRFNDPNYAGFADLSTFNADALRNKRYPDKLIRLIERMCAEDENDRPNFTQCMTELTGILMDRPELDVAHRVA